MARPTQQADLRLLSKVAKLYYEQNMTQNVIAERLHLSRPKVSRLLQQAVDEGIVQISILSAPGIHSALEQQLERTFDLQEVVIVDVDPSASSEVITREIGSAAATYLQRTIQDGDMIGVSWGSTLRAMVNALSSSETHDVEVVQVIGGLGRPESEMHATDLCRRIARLLDCRLTLLPAPGIVERLDVKQALLSDRYVQSAFNLFPKINVAYVGIGAPSRHSLLLQDGSIMNQAQMDGLLERGAVGDIALRFFDACGRPVESELDTRVVGITLDQLKQIPRVVGMAGGADKLAVTCSALRGGLLNVLITDVTLGQQLLECAPCGDQEQG